MSQNSKIPPKAQKVLGMPAPKAATSKAQLPKTAQMTGQGSSEKARKILGATVQKPGQKK